MRNGNCGRMALMLALAAMLLLRASAGAEAPAGGMLLPSAVTQSNDEYGASEGYYSWNENAIDYGPNPGGGVLGNRDVSRWEIQTIHFLDSLSGAPASAWDASANGDNSVRAWTDNGGSDLYVAADGGVVANPDSAYLFAAYDNLVEIDFAGCFDTSQVRDMSGMFYYSISLEELDLSEFDTSSVVCMANMFSDCYALRKVDLSSFDTTSVEDMSYMFCRDSALEAIDLSSFETPALKNMDSMFFYCSELRELNLKNFDTSNVKDYNETFLGCNEGLDIIVGDRFVMR